MAILDVFINFIQVTMPPSDVIILTDPASDLSVHRKGITIYPIEGEYSRDKLMLQRIRSYITFLERKLQEHSQGQRLINHYIFTDSDIAVVDDLGHIFQNHQNFHLALTFRNHKDQPLNSGFIAVRGTPDGILRAKVFLQEILSIYSSKYMNASRMLGDQLALAWVVKSHPSFDTRRFTKAQAFVEEIGGASVLFLPCATFNWTPPEGAGQFHGMPLDVKASKLSTRPIFQPLLMSPVLKIEFLLSLFSQFITPHLKLMWMVEHQTWLPLEMLLIVRQKGQWPYWMCSLTSFK
ncbi:uncharacterized protein LOC116139128 isoform X1 [Pistacia vera]|uniref:uncharacterized protein LOC116139128 isoform X1 n=1 Tax=Pistacia vera TaxID=55513 RepID=UPI001263C503|nr:uncharacterized protein LOC116139128 isoform X1 [Pistacia vera]